MPIDPGVAFDLDRGAASPDEDFGGLARHRAGRGSYGMRQAGSTVPGIVTFETIMTLLEGALEGGNTPTGAGADKTWTYQFDELSDTLKSYTLEEADELQGWQIPGAIISELELGFDALTVPGEVPWRFSATYIGRNKTPITITPALVAPAILETAEGHLARIYEGTTATAFGSLAELAAHLVQYRLRIPLGTKLRGYGSASDVPQAHGREKPAITFEALIRETASSKSNIYDIFATSGPVMTERRWRIVTQGSVIPTTAVNKELRIEHRGRFTAVPHGDRDGERLYQVTGDVVYDSTLASAGQITVINGQATHL
jgi:hypothetical protein